MTFESKPTPMELDPRALKCPLCAGPINLWAVKVRAGQEFQYDRCGDCGFAFVNPRPTMAALSRYYSAPIPDAAQGQAVIPVEQRRPGKWPTKAIGQILQLRPGPGHLLDVGAADGAFSLAAIRAGLEVTALEIDPDDLPALKSIPGIHFVERMFEGFDSPPESFDYVLMSHVLEHVHDPRAWIEKSAKLLRRGGILAIMLPHFGSVYRLLGGTRDPGHLNHFNIKSLSRVSEKYGLRVAKVGTTSEFKSDVITKRIAFPGPLAPAVRGLTTCICTALDWGAWAMGIGSVLIFYARKE